MPSRWLLRLDTVLRAVGLDGAIEPEPEVAGRRRGCSTPHAASRCRRARAAPAARGAAAPALGHRRSRPGCATPMRSMPGISCGSRRSTRSTPIPAAPSAASSSMRRSPIRPPVSARLPADAEAQLLAIGGRRFGRCLSRPGAWAFWWPRFERIARWFVAEESARRGDHRRDACSECSRPLILAGPGGPFELIANADRIDRSPRAGLLLIDYKTGGVPARTRSRPASRRSCRSKRRSLRPAASATVQRRADRALEYWQLGGGDPAGEDAARSTMATPRALIDARSRAAGLDRALRRSRDALSRVPSREWAPRYSDYRHLERVDRERGRGMSAARGSTGAARRGRAAPPRSGSRPRPAPARPRC